MFATSPWSDRFGALRCAGPDADGLLCVELAPGTAGNRMTATLHRELAALWPLADADADVRAVLVSGRDGTFGAGADQGLIAAAVEGSAAGRIALLDEARAIVVGLLDCQTPVVAAVEGAAFGAALGVALLADVAVVGPSTRLADGHAPVGVVAGDHAVLVLPLLCGMAQTKRMALFGTPVGGAEAVALGLVLECVPDDEVRTRAEALARRLARSSPVAVAWTKRALAHWYRLGLPAFESSLAHELLSYTGDDAREGLQALREGRRADFGVGTGHPSPGTG